MCMSMPDVDTSSQVEKQLSRSNAVLSNEKTATTTAEKTGNKRTMNSLRVPLKDKGSTVGINTTDTAAGLNIPV